MVCCVIAFTSALAPPTLAAVSTVLGNMVLILVETPSHRFVARPQHLISLHPFPCPLPLIPSTHPPICNRLLKHIIRCYLRLSDNARAREALRNCLPDVLKDPSTFANTLKSDVVAQRWLLQLLRTVYPEDALKFAAP
jgi:hypothetical protein